MPNFNKGVVGEILYYIDNNDIISENSFISRISLYRGITSYKIDFTTPKFEGIELITQDFNNFSELQFNDWVYEPSTNGCDDFIEVEF